MLVNDEAIKCIFVESYDIYMTKFPSPSWAPIIMW